MLADYHMHTSFSEDSTYPMEEVIKRAITLGLEEICFTEHVDYGVERDDNCDYKAYLKEFKRCKKLFEGQIVIKFGIEFGMQKHTIPIYQKAFEENDFDFVILSCHEIENKEFWTQDYQKGKTQKEYNENYYKEILAVMKGYDNYSILGHLDVIKRYDNEGEYPFEEVKDIITEILKYAIDHEKGIEVNTSNFRYGLKDLTPSRDILKLYKELGGKIITIGSDSHEESHVGYKIPYIQEELRKMGFTHICTFDKMKPIYHEL